MVPRALRKSSLGYKPARGWEVDVSKRQRKIYNCEFSQANVPKEGRLGGSKGHCGHQETCQKDSQPEGNTNWLCWKEGGMNSESSIETHSLPCVKQLVAGQRLHTRGNSAVLRGDPGGGWGGQGALRREGACVHTQLVHLTAQQG